MFAKMFEVPLQEAATGMVKIDDASAEVMTLFLEFLYTSTFKEEDLVEVRSRITMFSQSHKSRCRCRYQCKC